jgi:hypothetical protein
MPDQAQRRIEAYLSRVRARLRGLNQPDIREIVEELRSHILDKAASGEDVTVAAVDKALVALGTPEELATQYITDDFLARAEVSRSPVCVLERLFGWASLSAAGSLVLLGSVAGYSFGTIFVLCAALKPLHPQNAGLWVSRDNTGDLAISLSLGFGTVPRVGRDVLGWWIVPIGLLAGCGLMMLTTRFALWCARQYRRAHALPRVESH